MMAGKRFNIHSHISPKVPKHFGDNTLMDSRETMDLVFRLRTNVETVLLGKSREVELALASFLAGGHILLEDIPGTGKTTLARAISASISGTFRRIQFTSDLLPQDVVGVHIFDADKRSFTFSPGPLFANIVLADEINRSNPRAQSALLEAMGERQVSVDTKTYPLPDPFLVIATQNPFELHGTYPLPESQLDRFNLRIRLSYPDRESELRLIRENTLASARDGLLPVIVPEQMRQIRALVERVTVRDSIVGYIYRIVEATRQHPLVRLGASPRGAIGLKSTSQALAFLAGRDFVTPGDVQKTAKATLCHRIFLKGEPGEASQADAGDAILAEILEAVPSPV
jgi:MoxR-like ATPase